MEKEIWDLFSTTQIAKIRTKLKNIIAKLEKVKDRKERNEIVKEIVKQAKEKSIELKKEHEPLNNIYIYDESISPLALLVEEIIVDKENDEDVYESIKWLFSNYFNRFKTSKKGDNHISPEEIMEYMEVLEGECKFCTILQLHHKQLDIMLLDARYIVDSQLIKYNEVKNNHFSIQTFHNRAHGNIKEDNISLFFKQIGSILKYLVVGSSKRVPDGFLELCASIGIKDIDEETKNSIIWFDSCFVHYIQEKMERKIIAKIGADWKEGNFRKRDEEFAQRLIDYFDNLFCQLLEEQKEQEEWPDNEKSPCQRNKKYKDYCKKKGITYDKTEDEFHYDKVLPINDTLKEALYYEQVRFRNLFGRTLGKEEFVIIGALESDLTRFYKVLKNRDMYQRDKIYAYSKTGILLTEENIEFVSETEIKEFKKAVNEYHKLIKCRLKKDKANLLQVAEVTNIVLKEMLDYKLKDIIYVLNMFVNYSLEGKKIDKDFSINTLQDFLIYSAYKTSQNLSAIQQLVEEEYYENSMAIVRFIYEILINIRAYKQDSQLFEEKILSLAGIDKGTHEKVSKNKIIRIEDKKEINYRITVKELAQKAGENYKKLYDMLYSELSGFIHLDTLAVKNIFIENDLFLDLDECYMAGIFAMIFSLEIIMELMEYEGCNKRVSKDLEYFSNKMLKDFLDLFPTIIGIDDKEVYRILESTLQEYKKSYRLNYYKSKRYEVL